MAPFNMKQDPASAFHRTLLHSLIFWSSKNLFEKGLYCLLFNLLNKVAEWYRFGLSLHVNWKVKRCWFFNIWSFFVENKLIELGLFLIQLNVVFLRSNRYILPIWSSFCIQLVSACHRTKWFQELLRKREQAEKGIKTDDLVNDAEVEAARQSASSMIRKLFWFLF